MYQLWDPTSDIITDQLFALACGPDKRVWKYKGCIVNGVRFLVKDRDNHRRSSNSGISCEGVHNDKITDFYGILKGVFKIEYGRGYNVFMFSCDWYDLANRRTGIRKETHFTSVNISRLWYKNDPYILCSQAKQVFYVDDLKLGDSWKIVQSFNHRHVFDVPENEMDGTEGSLSKDIVNIDDETSDINIFVEDHEIGPMHRTDIHPEAISSSALGEKKSKNISEQHTQENLDEHVDDTDEDEFLEEIFLDEDEDDTLAEYCSDEEGKANEEDYDVN